MLRSAAKRGRSLYSRGPMTRTEIAWIYGPALLLIGGLVGFSCIRDAIAIRALAPAATPLVMPLRP